MQLRAALLRDRVGQGVESYGPDALHTGFLYQRFRGSNQHCFFKFLLQRLLIKIICYGTA